MVVFDSLSNGWTIKSDGDSYFTSNSPLIPLFIGVILYFEPASFNELFILSMSKTFI